MEIALISGLLLAGVCFYVYKEKKTENKMPFDIINFKNLSKKIV